MIESGQNVKGQLIDAITNCPKTVKTIIIPCFIADFQFVKEAANDKAVILRLAATGKKIEIIVCDKNPTLHICQIDDAATQELCDW